MELSETLIKKGNPSSLTDASVAAEVAFAGLRGVYECNDKPKRA